MRNLIDFTKASHGIKIKMNPENIKLRKFVRKTLCTLMTQIEGKEIDFECLIRRTGVPYTVICDKEKLE